MDNPWTPEKIAELTSLWNQEKLPAAEIARRMGMTKNAIVGKAGRLKLEPRGAPASITAARKRKAQQPVSVALSGRRCGWPVVEEAAAALRRGVPPTEVFCQAQALPGKSYCAPHHARSIAPRQPEPMRAARGER